MRVPLFLEARHGSQKIKAVRKVASIKSSPIRRTSLHRNSRRKPPNSFGWRNAANLSLPIYLVVPDERRVSFHPLC